MLFKFPSALNSRFVESAELKTADSHLEPNDVVDRKWQPFLTLEWFMFQRFSWKLST